MLLILALLGFVSMLFMLALVAVPILAWMTIVRVNTLPPLAPLWPHQEASREEKRAADNHDEMFLHSAPAILELGRRKFAADPIAANTVSNRSTKDAGNRKNWASTEVRRR